MNYNINITSIYPELINLDNTSGIKTFLAAPFVSQGDTIIKIENIEINVDSDKWLNHIQNKNPMNIITQKLNEVNFNIENDVASILLRKASLVIENKKASFLRFSGDNDCVYDSHEHSFDVGDRYIWLAGESLDFYRKEVAMKIIFSGNIHLQFDETDIVVQMIDFESLISKEIVQRINEIQYEFCRLRGNKFNHELFNNIESKLFDYEYSRDFFEGSDSGNIAYKTYLFDKLIASK